MRTQPMSHIVVDLFAGSVQYVVFPEALTFQTHFPVTEGTMLKRAPLVCCAVLSVVFVWAQAPTKIDPGSQPAANQLAAIARTIKECPRALSREKKWGKQAEEIERWYVGPPQNVTWDVVPGSSVRSPYVGYIEFSLGWDYWVADEMKDKFRRSEASSAAELLKTQEDVHPMKYRYEFDLGPNGLELTKMLRGRDPGNWVDERPDDTCWQKAARVVQRMSNETPPVVLDRASGIQSAGNVFLSDCDTKDEIAKQACQLWLGGFYNGLTAAGVMAVATPKEAAKNNVVCLPQTYTDEQLFHQILKYVKDHRREADQPTATLALAALQEAFSCKQ